MHYLTVSLASSGFHPGASRLGADAAWPVGRRLLDMAARAERAGLRAAWLGETPSADAFRLDPLITLGSLIGVTGRLGLGAHWSVDYAEPFHVARVFATLDHLSGGRTAWIVGLGGTAFAAQNRHIASLDAERYRRRAAEMIDIVRALWDSWEDEGWALDVPSGRFADPDRVHPIRHEGEFFAVRGPLNVPRPVQGNPLLVHALPEDERLRPLAFRTADVLLADLAAPAEARALRAAIRGSGRDPGQLRLLVNLMPILGGSEAEAQARARDLDATAPGGPSCLRFVGTPEQLVQLWGAWTGAADGFNLLPAVLPSDLEPIEEAIGIARRRGLCASDDPGPTLRARLGLARPRSRFAV